MNERSLFHGVPIKMYQSSGRLTVAAPMPGLEPGDIVVEVTPANRLILRGDGRGVLKNENFIHHDEWNPGPYAREIMLPATVDGGMANLTYRNGILVVVLPLAAETRPAYLGLDAVAAVHGERVGNIDRPVRAADGHQHVALRRS